MNRIILATAIVVLAATSGQAFARAASPTPREAAAADQRVYIDQPAYGAFSAFDAMVPQMSDADAHRYHGGPKSND
jgi:hypothetical protein